MRRGILLALPLLLAAGMGARRSPDTPVGERLRAEYTTRLDSLAIALDDLRDAAHTTSVSAGSIRQLETARHRARLAYKSVEGLLEYFAGMTASVLNGREDGDGDADDAFDLEEGAPAPEPLSGFAGIDARFTADSDAGGAADVERRALLMARTIRSARSLAKDAMMDEGRLFDAVRIELVRVTTLGLGGVDAMGLSDRIPEAAAALRGLRATMESCLRGSTGSRLLARRETNARFDRAIARLDASAADDFDALTFIVDYVYPLARAVNAERRARQTALPVSAGAWRASSDFIFDRNAFDPLGYAEGHRAVGGGALIALGARLFVDPVLSGDGTRSCATCHHLDRAFTENRGRTNTIDSLGRATARNAPTLINAGLQPALFADLRVRTLEEQVAAVVASPSEMRGNLDSAAARLSRSGEQRRAFARAFHSTANAVVTGKQVQVAVAAYMRSLIATDSRFDRAVRGDRTAMSARERHGFNVFMGKARCATCHFAPLFNGTLPPDYWSTPPEVIGVPASAAQSTIDPDQGRAGIDGATAHQYAFKTPTLRNVAITAPYMHNGAFRTLDEVVDFYDRGGGAGLGIDLPNQTLPRQKLGLTADERRDLVAFLGTLTDTVVPRPR